RGNLDNAEPLFIVGGLSERKTHYFENVVRVNNEELALTEDLKEKVDPYLRPLYDALNDTLGNEQVEKLLEKEVIEIAPLAYMRGRTLDNAFIILDEAQNTTKAQMKMFLTRMGFHSRIVITGDVTQIDLIKKKDSGLVNAKKLLAGIEGISFAELTSLDVVRNPLVQKIIERYEKEEE
ncbi:MAG: PhoH family protein, partial [Longicatena sp.]